MSNFLKGEVMPTDRFVQQVWEKAQVSHSEEVLGTTDLKPMSVSFFDEKRKHLFDKADGFN